MDPYTQVSENSTYSFAERSVLSDACRDQFAERCVSEDRSPYECYQDLTSQFGCVLRRCLPQAQLEMLQEVVLGKGPLALVLKNCPVTLDPGPTPENEQHSTLKKFQDEYFLLGLADVMDCIPWHEQLEKSGEFIHQVIAMQGKEDEHSSRGSKKRLGFHTELPHYQRPLDYIVLLCLRDDPNAYTEIVDGDRFLQGLPKEIIVGMQKAQFEFKTGPSFQSEQKGVYPFLEVDPQGGFFIRFLSGLGQRVVPKTAEAKKVLDYLSQYLESYNDYEKIYLKKGDCLILNNRKVLHGRGSFHPVENPHERRWLQRMYLYVNWRLLLHSRLSSK